MKNTIVITFLFLISISAFASTPSSAVEQIDKDREGNLSELVLKHFTENLKVECGEGSLAKFEIFKLSSGSANDSKTPETPYTYEARYLAIQKCLTGTTYVGAYLEVVKSVALNASFSSQYNRESGPKKMEGLLIEVAKDVTTVLNEQ